jgi:hypothetical protein
MRLAILVLCFVGASLANECDPFCEDYHRSCDELRTGGQPKVEDQWDQAKFDESEFSCDSVFWAERCPKTCDICVSCDYAQNNDLLGFITEEDVNQLEANLLLAIEGKIDTGGDNGASQNPESLNLVPVKEYTKSVYASDTYSTYEIYGPENMVDGHEGTGSTDVFMGKPNSFATITLDKNYNFKRVQVLNCATSETRLLKTSVQICQEFAAVYCVTCGFFTDSPKGGFAEVECPERAKGDTIKFQGSDYIQIGEVYFQGTANGDPVHEATSPADIYTSIWASSQFSSALSYGPQKMVDDLQGIAATDSFIGNPNSYASITLSGVYDITMVYALNRGDGYESRLKTTEVEICSDFTATDCVSCGQFPSGPRGGWSKVECENAVGDTIKFSGADYIQIVEVLFRGDLTNKSARALIQAKDRYESIFASSAYSASAYPVENMVNGEVGTAASFMFLGNANSYATITLDAVYSFSTVVVMNRGDSAETRLLTTEVEICDDLTGNNCVSCGKFTSATRGGWESVDCPSDAKGDTIKFSGTDYIQIVEVYFEATKTNNPKIELQSLKDIYDSYHVSYQYSTEANYGPQKLVDGNIGFAGTDSFIGYPNSYVSVTLDAIYSFEAVYVVNRGDGYETRLLTTKVEICDDFTATVCVSCGLFPTAPRGGYAKVMCDGAQGDTIRISATDYIQIVELFMVGEKKSANNKVILEATDVYDSVWSSSQYSSASNYGPQKMVDGVLATAGTDCFIGNPNSYASITLSDTYDFKGVIVVNRGDGGETRLAKTEVNICTDFTASKCVSCGYFPETGRFAYGRVDCPDSAVGSTIKFTSVDYIQGVEVLFEAKSSNTQPEELKPASDYYTSLFTNGQYSTVANYGPQKMIDGVWGLAGTDSFIGNPNSVAHITLDAMYNIKAVVALNRGDSAATRMALTKVEICEDIVGSNCVSCGNFPDTGLAHWGRVECPNDAVGDTIKFSSTDYVQAVEVYFVGDTTGSSSAVLTAFEHGETATTTSQYSSASNFGPQKMMDGITGSVSTDCFIGNPNSQATVTLDKSYNFDKVYAVNRGDGAETRMKTTKVEVCSSTNNCESCGMFPDTKKGDIAEVSCDGAAGDSIRFSNTDYLQIVEVYFRPGSGQSN